MCSSSRTSISHRCSACGCYGTIRGEYDYFLLKSKRSGFYATSLEILLQYLRARTLLLTGLTGDLCVLFTANDAFMRDYRLVVPADCVASRSTAANRRALMSMKHLLN